MAQLAVRVQATEESTQQREFGNVPNGIYKLEISASEVAIKNENTRDQATTVKVTIDVMEPEEFKGRKIFANYNVEHPKPTVQEIGNRQFSCLLRALGESESPEDTDELHFREFTARIGVGKDSKEKNADGTPQYPARNEIKLYYYPDTGDVPPPAIDANQPAASVTRAQAPANDNKPAPTRTAAAPGGARTPWGKK